MPGSDGQDPPKHRARLGIWFALVYIAMVAGVYLTTLRSKPDEFGYIWIPYLALAMPWYKLVQYFNTSNWFLAAIPCFFLNAVILFIVGTLLAKLRWSFLGIWLARIYIGILIAVLFIPALTMKPDNVGLGWIAFVRLASPWTRFNLELVLPGLLLNAARLYLIGMLIEKLWRPLSKRSA